MRRLIKIAFCAATAAVWSCQRAGIETGDDVEVFISAQGFSGAGSRTSDTGYTTTFASGDVVGITVIGNGGAVLEDNVPYVCNGSAAWEPRSESSAVHRYPGNITCLVYYPYSAAMDGKTSAEEITAAFAADADQSTQGAYSASDFMVGTASIADRRLSVTLSHVFSLIEVNAPAGAGDVKLMINGGAECLPFNISGTIYRYITKPAAGVSLGCTYSIAGRTVGWTQHGLTLEAGRYLRFNTVNAFYTGNVTVRYTDGTEEMAAYDPFTENIPIASSAKTVERVLLPQAGNLSYFVGRRADTPLKLKFGGSGELLFRAADAQGRIPVGSYAELELIGTQDGALEKSYVQEADLDFMSLAWMPIGSDMGGENKPFRGTFDGGGHTISNLNINRTGFENGALFGTLSGGTIRNVHIASGLISADSSVGGVCGYLYTGTITACSNAARIEGSDTVGGIVGSNFEGTMTACRNTGRVAGDLFIGGIAGSNYSSIAASYNAGQVKGLKYVGGVTGINEEFSEVAACYNAGMIAGVDSLASVVGVNRSVVNSCYWRSDTAVVGVNDDTLNVPAGAPAVSTDVISFAPATGFTPDTAAYPQWSVGDGSGTGYWKNHTGSGGLPQLWWEQ